MAHRSETPNNNGFVIRMLSRKSWEANRGRNRLLAAAVALSIVALTVIFGISYGKLRAETVKETRAAGTAAAICLEKGNRSQYDQIKGLSYVKRAGRSVTAASAVPYGNKVQTETLPCTLRWADQEAWEELLRPAYTDIQGDYPRKKSEILLSGRALEALGIENPRRGMQISLDVSIGLFREEQEEFTLCGWFTDYAQETESAGQGYVSQARLEQWGYDIEETADILIRQSDLLDWREAEDRLYRDVPMINEGQTITAGNTPVYDAVSRLAGGCGMAALGGCVILSGMFFLVCNVLQISLAGDIRQMGLFHTLGAREKQIRRIYGLQMGKVLLLGGSIGAILSAALLLAVIPQMLGERYLSAYGGGKELRFFWPGILTGAVLFTGLLLLCASAAVIRRVVNASCAESVRYTGIRGDFRQKRRGSCSASAQLRYMAWRNLSRYRRRFLWTALSLFLGMEAFLGSIVVIGGSDYENVIAARPDYLIAGQFSRWGQESGYGREYESRDAGEDPMVTSGDSLALLYDNEYDEFSPISREVREQLLDVPGVNSEKSYVMEGAYMTTTISKKGIRPLTDKMEGVAEKEGALDSDMVEGFNPDVIQLLNSEELAALERYVERQGLSVDMDGLRAGNAVAIVHDHALSREQEELAKQSVGEPVVFSSLMPREKLIRRNGLEETQRREAEEKGEFEVQTSETFTLGGYLDNRAEGFPQIRQTWHGAEGTLYYFISEKGFERLPTEKKTLYMELETDGKQEDLTQSRIQKILSDENRRRAEARGTSYDGDVGEAGLLCISKADLETAAQNEIQGSRLILGSISAILLFGGLTNYFNIVMAGVLSRKKELAVMESIGMTRRQRRKLILYEGGYYWLIVTILMLTVGNGILWLIRFYMEQKLSYFVFTYPLGWTALSLAGLAGICLSAPAIVQRKEE